MTGEKGVALSTAPRPGREYNPSNESQYRRGVAQQLQRVERALQQIRTAAQEEYTTANVTEDRDFDADSTTLAEVADVLGTLISDLQDDGVIG